MRAVVGMVAEREGDNWVQVGGWEADEHDDQLVDDQNRPDARALDRTSKVEWESLCIWGVDD